MNTTPRKFYAAEDGNNPYPGCKILTAENPNGQNSTSSGQPDKKLTPMAAHIEWLKKERKACYELCHDEQVKCFDDAIKHATPLLEAEREMVINSRQDGIDGMMKGHTISNNEFFTQNYRQQ